MIARSSQSIEGKSANLRLVRAGALLAVGALVSILFLVYAVRHESGGAILWLGLSSVTLICGSSICLFFALGRFLQSRQRRSTPIASPTLIDVEREYVAAYSRADQGIALTLAAFFGALTAFFVWRSTRLEGSVLSALLFCGTISYAIEMIATRVRFTRQGFVARLSWFRHLQEPYERVERISGKPGTLTIHFSDGQLLKLHSGLGDADTVIAYLQAHCPESVRIE